LQTDRRGKQRCGPFSGESSPYLNVARDRPATSVLTLCITERAADGCLFHYARLRGRWLAVRFVGVLNRFGGGGQDVACARARATNPGTVTLFPANGAGNKLAVPGLRRIPAQFPQNG
jgi:hypothetical protein